MKHLVLLIVSLIGNAAFADASPQQLEAVLKLSGTCVARQVKENKDPVFQTSEQVEFNVHTAEENGQSWLHFVVHTGKVEHDRPAQLGFSNPEINAKSIKRLDSKRFEVVDKMGYAKQTFSLDRAKGTAKYTMKGTWGGTGPFNKVHYKSEVLFSDCQITFGEQ